MIDRWLEEVKQKANPEDLGMILVHNGIVRGTSKSGKPVQGMKLSYDQEKLNSVIPIFKTETRGCRGKGLDQLRKSEGR